MRSSLNIGRGTLLKIPETPDLRKWQGAFLIVSTVARFSFAPGKNRPKMASTVFGCVPDMRLANQ
jgi:hypothetical protein